MELRDLGFTSSLEAFIEKHNPDNFTIARVTTEHRERYLVHTSKKEVEAEISGALRYSAASREDFPAVGDWVAITEYESDFALIHKILPRSSVLKRQAVAKHGEIQVLAANIDFAFLVQALDRDFNINRLERYLSICHSSNVKPIIVLTKTDLLPETQVATLIQNLKSRIPNIPVLSISNYSMDGFKALQDQIVKAKTYCLLGSSGVGKSSLLNNLCGKSLMRTEEISTSNQKGRHITTHRELVILENGGIIIDSPGMREVGVADAAEGVRMTFDHLLELGETCRFKDCTHTTEPGCTILEALQTGKLEQAQYENYLKLRQEESHFETSARERKQKEKAFGKFQKNYLKNRPPNKL